MDIKVKNKDWQEVFDNLPETTFFRIVRHYLGGLSTPFHKPELIRKMSAFLNNPETLESTIRLINNKEAEILTIIAFHKNPNPQNIHLIANNEEEPQGISSLHINSILLNLRERLLIFPPANSMEQGETPSCKLTPLGQKILQSGLLGPARLLGPGKDYKPAPPGIPPWLNDNFLTAYLSLTVNKHIKTSEKGLVKAKKQKILAEHFPSLFIDSKAEKRIQIITSVLEKAGLIHKAENHFTANLSEWYRLETITPRLRLQWLTAKIVLGENQSLSSAYSAIDLCTRQLPEGKYYHRKKLAKLFNLALNAPVPLDSRETIKIFDKLLLLGLLVSPIEGHLAPSPLLRNQNPSSAGEVSRPLYVTPTGEFILQPHMPLSVNIAISLQHKKTDTVTSFLLTKNTFLASMEQNINVKNLINQINTLSSRHIPSNILTNIKDWENQYQALELKPAIILKARNPILPIIQESRILDPYTYSKPAPDTWLLDPAKENSWREALRKLDITHIPGIIPPPESPPPAPSTLKLPTAILPENHTLTKGPWAIHPDKTSLHLQELHKKAATLQLSDQDSAILCNHIQRKIILRTSQLRPPTHNEEIKTARGLEHQNKIRLCEFAIANPENLLEITHSQNSQIVKVLLRPLQIEKQPLTLSGPAEHILTGSVNLETNPIRIPLRKISLIKRIETSLIQ